MAKSLADQLAGIGLVDKKQLQKGKAEKRKQERVNRKHRIEEVDETKVLAEQARKDKIERDRQLNKERQQAADKKALIAQVRQIIEQTHIKFSDGEVKFNFADRFDNKIKALYVTDVIQRDLVSGKLAIATVEGKYYVVAKAIADKIVERSDDSILFLAEPKSDAVDEDDPYKDYVIPDDLMW